jgi:hypothetical protein
VVVVVPAVVVVVPAVVVVVVPAVVVVVPAVVVVVDGAQVFIKHHCVLSQKYKLEPETANVGKTAGPKKGVCTNCKSIVLIPTLADTNAPLIV